ncbi:MAG TPA: cytochrome P450 [Micromonosporaceae bacterium]|nr:cytochrome P450 [Micromonosporaceae bacterium]
MTVQHQVTAWPQVAFPRPPGRIPLLGDLRPVSPRAPLQDIMRLAQGLGPIFEVKAFRHRIVVVAAHRYAAQLCDEDKFEKAQTPGHAALRRRGGDGIFTAYNDEPAWRLAHDLLLPAFSRASMQRYHHTMTAVLDELIEVWGSAADRGQWVDIPTSMTRMTIEILCRCAFGTSMQPLASLDQPQFVTAMLAGMKSVQRRASLQVIPGIGAPVASVLELANRRHFSYVDDFLDGIIAKAQRERPGDDSDMLGIMLTTAHPETGEKLSLRNIRYQILTFLVAGHETTAGALSFALHFLLRNPHVMRRAQEEVDRLRGQLQDGDIRFEDVPKFRYLRRVLEEALRLWPTAPGFSRTPKTEALLGDSWLMRHGDWATIILPLLHRDPEVWGPEPEVFDPDRFLPEKARERPAHAYKPFGTGQRACLGRHFTMHEGVLALARLLSRFTFHGDPAYDLKVAEHLTVAPTGLRAMVQRRGPAAPSNPMPASRPAT